MKSTPTTRKSRSKTAATLPTHPESRASLSNRAEHIAVSAYFKAQARGFSPGQELDDWLQAEAELSAATPAA